jgi:hypothetical protein
MVDAELRCRGTTKDGKPCGAHPRPGTELCPWHSPDLAGRRAEWSARGGMGRSNKRRAKKALPAEPLTAEEIHSYLGVVFRGVIGGKIEPGIGTAAASIARAMVDVAKVADFESQLSEMRRDLAALTDDRSAS